LIAPPHEGQRRCASFRFAEKSAAHAFQRCFSAFSLIFRLSCRFRCFHYASMMPPRLFAAMPPPLILISFIIAIVFISFY
jgi:hypothetical protein